MDLLLDSTGDLDFTGGDFNTCTGAAEVVQRLKLRLNVRRGEWLLDLLFGVDWLGTIFVKAPNLTVIDAHLKSLIAGTEGVESITAYSSSVTNRRLTVQFEVQTSDDSSVSGQLAADPEGSAAAFQVGLIGSFRRTGAR